VESVLWHKDALYYECHAYGTRRWRTTEKYDNEGSGDYACYGERRKPSGTRLERKLTARIGVAGVGMDAATVTPSTVTGADPGGGRGRQAAFYGQQAGIRGWQAAGL